MSDLRSKHILKPHVWLITLIGVIVPRNLRPDWRQEWEAELRCRELLLDEWEKLSWRTRLDLLRRSLGAFWDALVLQPRRLEDGMFQDLRYGARMLLKKPGFTLLAVFTLALGIGASTSIFSAVNPILFESLPYPSAGRLVMIWDHGVDDSRIDVTFHTYRELAERSRSFDALAVMKPWQPAMTSATEPERLDGQRVSASYFRVLGVSPVLGRDLHDSDDQFNGPNVVVLSDGLWRRSFGGDSTVVGRQVTLDDNLHVVIGVMPGGFENVLAPSADLWSPLQYDAGHITSLQTREWGHHLRMVGRLRPGVGRDQARRELDEIAHAPVSDLHIGLQQRSPRAAGGHQLTRRSPVVAQVALALVLW